MSERVKPWVESRLPAGAAWRQVIDRPMPRDLPYLATLGALIAGTMVLLAASGLVLAVYYDPWHAFDARQFIAREVNYGWLIEGFHATGTTMLFATLYLAIFRGMLGRGFTAPGEIAWFLKLTILLLMLLVGYLGYTMADGAASYESLHGAALAATRLGGFPGAIGVWFFGGPDSQSTLARLAVLHAALALAGFLLLALYFAAKRAVAVVPQRPVALHPYYSSQYYVAFVVFALIFAVLLFFAPHLGENPLNLAGPSGLVVPAAAAPPWYLLPAGALAQALHGAGGHIVAFIAAFAVLYALPWLDRSAPGAVPGSAYRVLVYVLALDVVGLCVVSVAPGSVVAGVCGVLFTAWYFLHFLVLTPMVTASESK